MIGLATNINRIYWLTERLLHDRFPQERRSEIIWSAAAGSEVTWLVVLSDRLQRAFDNGEHGDHLENEALVDRDTIRRLLELSLDRLRAASVDGSLVLEPRLPALLHSWQERAGAAEVRLWTDEQLGLDAFVLKMADETVTASWSQGMGGFGFLGDVAAARREFLHLAPLEEVLDVGRFRARVVELLDSDDVDEEQRRILNRFNRTPERNPARDL